MPRTNVFSLFNCDFYLNEVAMNVSLLICVCSLVCTISGYEFVRHVIRNTSYGQIRGNFVKSKYFAEVYLGVPYAASPIEELRFQYPKEPNQWTDVKDCTTAKPECCQFITVEDEYETEDCLYINIISPQINSTEDLLPVLVWIHGGSYLSDDANMFPIDGTINNLANEKMIVIFVNYRLGALGFLSLNNSMLPGNIGLEDQLMALHWIQKNIKFFHGNPEKVTLIGESAGAACTSFLAMSPKSKGLFHQIFLRSGSGLAPWAMNVEQTVKNTKFVLNQLGCDAANETRLRQCLQASSVQDMKKHMQTLIKGPNSTILFPLFTPVIDVYRLNDSILPAKPEVLLKTEAKMPMVAGVTSAESLGHLQALCRVWLIRTGNKSGYDPPRFPYLEFPGTQSKTPNWQALIAPPLFKNPYLIYQSIHMKYFGDDFSKLNRTEHLKVLTQALSDYFMVAPLLEEAKYYAKQNLPVYLYRYGYKTKFLSSQFSHCPDTKEYTNDAIHGLDIALLFQSSTVLHLDIEFAHFSPSDLFISDLLRKQICNFLKFGNPNWVNEENETIWQKYSLQRPVSLYFDAEVQQMIKADNCTDFWFRTVPTVDNLNVPKCV